VSIFRQDRAALIGVVHLHALPGSPRNAEPLPEIIGAAVRDALAYVAGGADGLIIENFGDAPFHKQSVQPHTVAMMTRAALEVKQCCSVPFGINVLRNDASAALGIAAATGARFIRVNIHTGAMFTDQGLIEGQADVTLRYRSLLGARVEIWADVLVKHGAPPGGISLEAATDDAVLRGLADAVIVTGTATGSSADPAAVRAAKNAARGVPVLVGSGVSAGNAAQFLPDAAGFIVGTWAKRDGVVSNPVDVERVRLLRDAIDGAGLQADR
jgi:uncharacterized protein